jgi:hypothetical protein
MSKDGQEMATLDWTRHRKNYWSRKNKIYRLVVF